MHAAHDDARNPLILINHSLRSLAAGQKMNIMASRVVTMKLAVLPARYEKILTLSTAEAGILFASDLNIFNFGS